MTADLKRRVVRLARPGILGLGALAIAGCTGGSGSVSAGNPIQNASSVYATAASGLDFEYYRENVEPVFMRPRGGFVGGEAPCVSCHTFQTSTPLKLEPLREENGQVFWTEDQSRRNFQVVSRLVMPHDPDNSRLLNKPLAVDAGGAPQHTGGKFWDSKEDAEWRVLAEWVRTASADARPPAPMPMPDFEFFRQCVQPVFVNPIPNAIACTECHSGGGSRAFARPVPEGQATWTVEESQASYDALMELIEPGQPELSRFLHHPLDPRAGGDFMHNGGRRWQTKSDPEWQALAAWVRGESTGTSCPAALQFPNRR